MQYEAASSSSSNIPIDPALLDPVGNDDGPSSRSDAGRDNDDEEFVEEDEPLRGIDEVIVEESRQADDDKVLR